MIKQLYKKFINKTLLTGLISGVVLYIIFVQLLPNYYHPAIPYMLIFAVGITLLVHWYLLNALPKRPQAFINTFLMFMGIKMLGYLLFLVIVVFFSSNNIVPFVLSFFGIYIIFTVFETLIILKTEKLFRDNTHKKHHQ